MTPHEILKQLSAVRKLPVAREVARRAGASVTCTDLLTLWDMAHGECIKADGIKTRRTNLMKAGLMESVQCPNGTKAANNRVLMVYRLTKEGESVIAKLRDELQKISDRIKRKANQHG